MIPRRIFVWPLFVLALWTTSQVFAAEKSRQLRVIVTTDGEVDDRCSMVRFLLYTNHWNVCGLIHSSSKHHWRGNAQVAGHKWNDVGWLDKQLLAYEAVYPNLKRHDARYPSPDALRDVVFVGNIEFEGDMRAPTPGSDQIVKVLLDPDPSPVWLQAWGGSNTIARALKTIQEQHPDRIDEVAAKAKIFLISQQDYTWKEYIRKQWPNVDVLLSNYDSFGAIAYGWGRLQSPEVKKYFGRVWMREHILQKHGPLLDLYEHKELRFRSEGDSPAFLHVIDTGLYGELDPTYGDWGGRFVKVGQHYWKSADDKTSRPHSILRWAIDFQNDWAARADWCVAKYDEANHPPTITADGVVAVNGKPGERIKLNVLATDPDDDDLAFRWWQHQEAGSYSGEVTIRDATNPHASMQLPAQIRPGQTLHLICSVSDDGSPPLTRYQRIIVTCRKD